MIRLVLAGEGPCNPAEDTLLARGRHTRRLGHLTGLVHGRRTGHLAEHLLGVLHIRPRHAGLVGRVVVGCIAGCGSWGRVGRGERMSLTGCRLFVASWLLLLLARQGLVLVRLGAGVDGSLWAELGLALLLELRLAKHRNRVMWILTA